MSTNITVTEAIEEVATILNEGDLEFSLEELYFMLSHEGEHDLALETIDGFLESIKDGFYEIDDVIEFVSEILDELSESFVKEYLHAIS